jgi:hypothetical protein
VIVKPTRFEVAVILLIASAFIYQNFVPPLIGLADSGDFNRLFSQTGLTHFKTDYNDRYFYFFNRRYRIVEPSTPRFQYMTSSSFLVHAARWLSITSGEYEFFDIRVVAALRLIVLLFGMWLILIAARSLSVILRIVLAALLVLMFTDVGYVAYFNSFYSEPTALCFLSIGIGSALSLVSRRSSSPLWLAGYIAAIAMVETSKPQYVPLSPFFALFGIYLARHLRWRHRYWFAGGLAFTLIAMTMWYYRQTPEPLRKDIAYLGVFSDLLPHSSTPREDLEALGLNPDYAEFSGTTPYQKDSPLKSTPFGAEFQGRITSDSLPLFYATHPKRLYELCKRCAKWVFINRIARLGVYEAESGKPPQTQGRGLWSSIRENAFPRSLIFVSLFIASGIPAVALSIKARSESMRSLYAFYLLLVLTAVVQFLVAIVAQGEMDLAKHLFMFNLAFDICLILLVLGGIHIVLKHFAGSEDTAPGAEDIPPASRKQKEDKLRTSRRKKAASGRAGGPRARFATAA